MKKLVLFSIFSFSTTISMMSFAAVQLDPELRKQLQPGAPQNQWTTVIVGMETASLRRPPRYARQPILAFLRQVATSKWSRIESSLLQKNVMNTDFKKRSLFYINTAFSASVTPRGLRALLETPGLESITVNRPIFYDLPVARHAVRKTAEVPYNYVTSGLVPLINELPKIDGTGIVIGSVDTGVDGTHPEFKNKIVTFYDGRLNKVSTPVDYDSHGTHTIGTMIGSRGPDSHIGVAPGAKMIAAGALGSYEEMLRGMQFMLDPDGNPQTADMPRAINNSWNCQGASAAQLELFYKAIEAWEAVGILPVYSAGNAGPRPKTITRPHEHPLVIAVGATQQDAKITSFSSRGPGVFRDKETPKPDFTAPGKDIVSSVPGGKYASYSGTSMAAPHVTAAAALVFQVNPAFNPQQVRMLLTSTVTPLKEDGTPGTAGEWNAVYGYGAMNIYAAVKKAMSLRQRMSFSLNHSLLMSADDLYLDSIAGVE